MKAMPQEVLVTGATGFVGRALVPALLAAGYSVRATTRKQPPRRSGRGVTWVQCDVAKKDDLARALQGVQAAFFLVHGMGAGAHQYAEREREIAKSFRVAAADAKVERIVYLGGVAPRGKPSQHLRSRLAVGESLRGGTVPTLELRSSMIVGVGSASWQIVRDVALRLPAMLLPQWTKYRTRPLAIEDALVALVAGLTVELPVSAWYDIAGPDTLSGREILETIARVRGRRIPSVPVPLLSAGLASHGLRFVTRVDFDLARELVLGFTGDLLPEDDRYWDLIGTQPSRSFEDAARRALGDERFEWSARGAVGRLEEALVQACGVRL